MDPVDWVDASLCQQRSLNSVYQRDTDDGGVNSPYSIYSHADARNSDGEPLEDEGDAELSRKIHVLRAIEERILHKKAAILIKAIEMIKKTETPDFKGATLRDRVTTILQQRHSLNFRSKGETNWSPTERDDSPSHSTVLLEDHHPLKLRVKAVMKHRVCEPSGFTSKSPVSNHEMATRPPPPPPPSKSISSQIMEESVANKGFECFLNLLNKGVDMDLLSRIVNDDSEDLHLEDQPFNSEASGVTEDSDLPTSSERLQFNSGPHLSENSGDRTELPTREQSPKETNSLPDDNKNGNDSLSSSSRSRSPLTMEKTKKEEKEMSKVDEQHEQLQNILNTLGLRLEVEDLSKLTDRTQERLYGKRNESIPVAASRTEQQSPVTTTGSCKIDRKSSSSSPSSFSSSRSCSRSPSYRQLAQSRESQDRHKKESFSACCGSRKTREELSSLYITQDDIQARTTVGKNKGDDIFNEIPYIHSHCDPTLSACPDYTFPHYSHYDTTYSSDTSSYWTSTPGVSTTPHYPSSSPYSMDTNHSHHAIPSVRHDRDSLENVFCVNPDLSMSEGQFGSISGPGNLQVVNMKHPLGHCLPRMTGDMSLDKEQSDQEKTKRLKLLEEQVQDVQTLGCHWDNNIPFVAKHIKASGKKVEPTHGQKDKSKKKQTPTDEEIKANLRKKLEAFNQMSKNKSHAQPNPYSDTQMCDV
ncbi:uncharacterized protein LOC133403662 isoform X3 [Phycodurus eques]|uniref:uncharacterized protein LOC133403662 isoform X3 n=1 Tax=Phycodurus eques TaxID=693459 RepID=UPI002ACEDDDA|nr:uncharacterized protein LOC133403662 isoform X3 [Phycodurus eques]